MARTEKEHAKDIYAGQMQPDQLGIEVLDERTLQVQLEQPTPYFLEALSLPAFYPLNSSIARAIPDWEKDMDYTMYTVSNGPFLIADWDREEIVLEKNSRYWDAAEVQINRIEVVAPSDELEQFAAGELDWTLDPIGRNRMANEAKVRELLEREEWLVSVPAAHTSWYALNHTQPPLHNKKIRQALAYAINREELVKARETVFALAVMPPGLLSETEQGYFPDHDVARAASLFREGLREEGYADPSQLPTMEIIYVEHSPSQELVHRVAQMWQQNLGLEVKPTLLERHEYEQSLLRGQHQIAYIDVKPEVADPAQFLDVFKQASATNPYGWHNTQVENLLDQAAAEPDAAKRNEMLRRAETIVLEEMPVIPLTFSTHLYAQQPHVQGVVISRTGSVDFRWAYLD